MKRFTSWTAVLLAFVLDALMLGIEMAIPRKLRLCARQVVMGPVWLMGLTNLARSDIAEADPIPETVQKFAGPVSSGITYQAPSWVKIALGQVVTNGISVAQQNPYGEDRLITRAVVRITTAGGTASSVIDVDVVAGATSTGDDIFDGIAANTAAIKDSLNSTDNGSNGEGKSWLWEKAGGTNDYVTGKVLVAGASAIVGSLFLESIPAA